MTAGHEGITHTHTLLPRSHTYGARRIICQKKGRLDSKLLPCLLNHSGPYRAAQTTMLVGVSEATSAKWVSSQSSEECLSDISLASMAPKVLRLPNQVKLRPLHLPAPNYPEWSTKGKGYVHMAKGTFWIYLSLISGPPTLLPAEARGSRRRRRKEAHALRNRSVTCLLFSSGKTTEFTTVTSTSYGRQLHKPQGCGRRMYHKRYSVLSCGLVKIQSLAARISGHRSAAG